MSERSEFLSGLNGLAIHRGVVWYRCGDLAKLVGISPLDVLDKTQSMSISWDHPDYPHAFMSKMTPREARDWAMKNDEVHNIDIAFPASNHAEKLADALGILPEGEE